MAGSSYEFFGYRADDNSEVARAAAAVYHCPIINMICAKTLNDGLVSGVCAIKPTTSPPVICCPIRLYADNCRILHLIADEMWGQSQQLVAGGAAKSLALTTQQPVVAVFGKRWGGELRLPKKGGHGNYFMDWMLSLISPNGEIQEFIAIEIQTMDTTGNYRDGRVALLHEQRQFHKTTVGLNWENVSKRILPQLIYKGQVLRRESLAKKGLVFVCPKQVFDRILARLGGRSAILPYPIQPGSITLVAYDYDQTTTLRFGEVMPLAIVDRLTTSIERLQRAFNDVTLETRDVYKAAIAAALG